MRIGFLFNHDQVHQVAHSLPIALALARANVQATLVVATTSPRLTAEVIRLGGGLVGSAIQLVELRLKAGVSRALEAGLDRLVPARKLLIYRDNLEFFRGLDVLVAAEKTSLVLKTRYGLDRLRIVHTRHGAGDRAVGFDRASAGFDHVLCSGPLIRERLIRDAGVDPAKISVVGYPKFDLPREAPARRSGERPVVLYNPHVSPHLSSWYSIGRRVLDWFAEHDGYDLIFAPHVMLFERPYVLSIDRLRVDRPGRIAETYLRASNIRIDLGSRLATTMAYTQQADIYLGDASSQVYEFLLRPRPCVFLNPRRLPWREDDNFAHWHAGRVIERVEDLQGALADANDDHRRLYRGPQKRMFEARFDLSAQSSSERAAQAVARFAGLADLGLRAPPAAAPREAAHV